MLVTMIMKSRHEVGRALYELFLLLHFWNADHETRLSATSEHASIFCRRAAPPRVCDWHNATDAWMDWRRIAIL